MFTHFPDPFWVLLLLSWELVLASQARLHPWGQRRSEYQEAWRRMVKIEMEYAPKKPGKKQ